MKPTMKARKAKKSQTRRHEEATVTIRRSQLIAAAVIASSGMVALAATVPNTFSSGSPAAAADVNANFQALALAVTELEAKLASVSLVTVNGQPTVRFSGVNVQVVNGTGATTGTPNGTGNLIIGYDEADSSGTNRCSIGMNGNTQVNTNNCVANGGTLSTAGFKTGSHYLVLGSENNYSSFGGIVAGYRNFSNWSYASVSGGHGNTASGTNASVGGGYGNTASGYDSSVSGGYYNTASGGDSSVSGGYNNTASGAYASVGGGYSNTANFYYASVGGGAHNTASGTSASVSGGVYNTASGNSSSVSGGNGCSTGVLYGWDVGGTSSGCSANVGQ